MGRPFILPRGRSAQSEHILLREQCVIAEAGRHADEVPTNQYTGKPRELDSSVYQTSLWNMCGDPHHSRGAGGLVSEIRGRHGESGMTFQVAMTCPCLRYPQSVRFPSLFPITWLCF